MESLFWGALVPVVGGVWAEKGDGGDYGVGDWFSCCWMWSSALPWERWPFLPPTLDAGDPCGVLVLFHPCSSTWYLPLAPPDMGSSGFWGAPTLCFLGEGGQCILCQHSAALPWQRGWRLPGCRQRWPSCISLLITGVLGALGYHVPEGRGGGTVIPKQLGQLMMCILEYSEGLVAPFKLRPLCRDCAVGPRAC